MTTIVMTIVFFSICFLGMSLGVMIRGRALKGSCGGASAVLGEDNCGACARKAVDICPSDDESGLVAMSQLGHPSRTLKDKESPVDV